MSLTDPLLPKAKWHTTTAEGAAFVETMPMTVDQAIDVFEITFNLLSGETTGADHNPCNGDLRRVQRICASNGADFEAVSTWLKRLGATCDCRVFEVDKLFDELVELDDSGWDDEIREGIEEGRFPADYTRFISGR